MIKKLELYIEEATEKLWLYQVEDDVLMVEVMPDSTTASPIGQVVLKRLITADQAIEKLCAAAAIGSERPIPQQLSQPS